MSPTGRNFSYVLPLRMTSPQACAADELTAYLQHVVAWCDDVIVVDGSPKAIFEANGLRWQGLVHHAVPSPAHASLSGKVQGVLTGVGLARHNRVVIADDDIRYGKAELDRTVSLLDTYDLICPQNYFLPLPWHALWDTARTLLNRATIGADFPGTLAVRRSSLLDAGGYDGDVLFENLELIRTIRAHDGAITSPLDLYVSRLPPALGTFLASAPARLMTISRCRRGWRSGWPSCRVSLRRWRPVAWARSSWAPERRSHWPSTDAAGPAGRRCFHRLRQCLPPCGCSSEPFARGWRFCSA